MNNSLNLISCSKKNFNLFKYKDGDDLIIPKLITSNLFCFAKFPTNVSSKFKPTPSV